LLELRINGELRRVDAEVGRSLAEVLREDLGLT
jgi:aerobic-type carbon monoxide dehydrogenase small subunit (CoxS/CutS family)